MDNKKLIGTILGVIAFIALIAGATFAWLSATVVINNQYTTKSKNFIITYGKGNDIGTDTNKVLMLKNPTKSNVTTGKTTVTASKTVSDAPVGSFKLHLNVTSNTFAADTTSTKNTVIIYAACKTSSCPSTALATVTKNASNVIQVACGTGVTCGSVKTNDTTIDILEDTTTFDKDNAAVSSTYDVYVWIDSEFLTDTEASSGAQFIGNISASATQSG